MEVAIRRCSVRNGEIRKILGEFKPIKELELIFK